jgi:serine protease Do
MRNTEQRYNAKRITLRALAACALACFGLLAAAQEKGADDASDPNRQSVATGFFISDGGYVVTSNHVVEGFEYIYIVMGDRRVLRAQLVKADVDNDLALLKVGAITPFLYLSHSQGVPPGMEVVTIGYPLVALLGFRPKITKGIVNSNAGLKDELSSFQFSAEIQKGNSGGPLIGPGGTVVGVVKAKLDAFRMSSINKDLPQNVNFAVKSSVLIKFLQGTPSIPFTRPLNANVTINPIAIFAEQNSAVVPIVARNTELQKK